MNSKKYQVILHYPRNIGSRVSILMSPRTIPGKFLFFRNCEARKVRPQLEKYGFIISFIEVKTEQGSTVTCVLPRFTDTDQPIGVIQGYNYVGNKKLGASASRNYLKTRLPLPGLVLVETPKGFMDVRQAVKNKSGGRVVLRVQ